MEACPISYAPAVPLHQTRKFRRLVITAVLLLVMIPLAVKLGPPGIRRARLLYLQRLALRYAPPPDQVVYDDDPADYQRLLNSGEFEEQTGSYSESTAFRQSSLWQRFSELAAPPGAVETATLFMHERRNSRGERRLVVVEGGMPRWILDGPNTPDEHHSLVLWTTVFRPAGIFSNAAELSSAMTRIDGPADRLAPTRWYAGQPDPNDESHFTLTCDHHGTRVILDGWLRDDDTLTLESRSLRR